MLNVKTKAPDIITSQENRSKDFLNKCVCQKKEETSMNSILG